MSDADPYLELAELAETAASLAEQDRLDELGEVLDRSSALTATLPEDPAPGARPALERAVAAHDRLRARLGSSAAATQAELQHVDRGRQAARSYGSAGASVLDRRA